METEPRPSKALVGLATIVAVCLAIPLAVAIGGLLFLFLVRHYLHGLP